MDWKNCWIVPLKNMAGRFYVNHYIRLISLYFLILWYPTKRNLHTKASHYHEKHLNREAELNTSAGKFNRVPVSAAKFQRQWFESSMIKPIIKLRCILM